MIIVSFDSKGLSVVGHSAFDLRSAENIKGGGTATILRWGYAPLPVLTTFSIRNYTTMITKPRMIIHPPISIIMIMISLRPGPGEALKPGGAIFLY